MIFALDIGTRKVAGIIGELTGDKMRIIDAVVREHEKRAMLDGQIHNIAEVSKIVTQVKTELEARNNIKITKVVTALAGRNLLTAEGGFETQKKGEVTAEDIAALEIESVRKAYESFEAAKKAEFYCVGFSPVYYTLDGAQIKNPIQHLAKEKIGVHSIATFLPRNVFDSMAAVLKNCGLEIEAITLEPIAAIRVTIPEDMRLLNIALVDVGAGTSDIAITDSGKITSYGMIPKAGDEITEAVCNAFIVDFSQGEKIKRTVSPAVTAEATDIFNNTLPVSYNEFCEKAGPRISEVAKEIADGILELNKKQPQAVVMVGGGSSLQLLKELVAENLGLPVSRVGSRLPKNILNLENVPEALAGTDGITPMGILETALFKKGIGFIDVYINGEKEYIINLEREIKVIDAIVSSGRELKKLYGRPGSALTYTFNGELQILRGGQAQHSKIFVNSREKGLYDRIQAGDTIFITEASGGTDAAASIKDIIPADYFITCSVNTRALTLEPVILKNGRQVTADEPLSDRDEISASRLSTAREVLAREGLGIDSTDERDIIVTVNNEPVMLKQRNYQLKVNGAEVSADYQVKNMDKLEFKAAPAYFRIKDVVKGASRKKITVSINGKPFEIESESSELLMNGKKVLGDEFIINGAAIEYRQKGGEVMLSHIFKTYPVDMEQVRGKMVEFLVNGQKAGYTTKIEEGSQIEIRFY